MSTISPLNAPSTQQFEIGQSRASGESIMSLEDRSMLQMANKLDGRVAEYHQATANMLTSESFLNNPGALIKLHKIQADRSAESGTATAMTKNFTTGIKSLLQQQ